ncbi:MAG: hypothetical protein ACK44W_06650 [Planctomycetota bacterium]
MRRARALPLLLLATLAGLATLRNPPAPAFRSKSRAQSAAATPAPAGETTPPSFPSSRPPAPPAQTWCWTREDRARIGALEERLLARLREEPSFEEAVFQAFLTEADPMWMAFLQNLLADDPRRRNAPAWQDRFARVAETEPVAARRRAALLFLQRAEAIGPALRTRLFTLAERSDLRGPALLALGGLPGRRPADPELVRLATHLAEQDPDPAVRALARLLARRS